MCISGHRILHGAQNVAVIKRRQTVRQSALNADFGSAQFPRFFTLAPHVFERMKIGVGLARSAAEGAKLAAHETDVREIDIAIDHVADDVADQVAPQRVGGHQQCEQVASQFARRSSPGHSALRPSGMLRLAFPARVPRRCESRRKLAARSRPRSARGIARVLKPARP